MHSLLHGVQQPRRSGDLFFYNRYFELGL
uniref:Uncharacterized protein n=1 Tax=Lepeophtheirus salmonis TaxID=72036 RepID=A0A0K2TI27_LEPSM